VGLNLRRSVVGGASSARGALPRALQPAIAEPLESSTTASAGWPRLGAPRIRACLDRCRSGRYTDVILPRHSTRALAASGPTILRTIQTRTSSEDPKRQLRLHRACRLRSDRMKRIGAPHTLMMALLVAPSIERGSQSFRACELCSAETELLNLDMKFSKTETAINSVHSDRRRQRHSWLRKSRSRVGSSHPRRRTPRQFPSSPTSRPRRCAT
jgi:hypothetical protein